MSVDRQGWVNSCLDGFGIAFGGYLAPGNEFWLPDDEYGEASKYIKYDPEGARAILQEAGCAPGDIKVTLDSTAGYGVRWTCEVELTGAGMNAIGIDTELNLMDYDSYVGTVWKGSSDLAYSWHGFGTLPEEWLMVPFRSDLNGIKMLGLNEPEMDELLNKISTTSDPGPRIEFTQQAAKLIADQAWFVSAPWWLFVWGNNPRLVNYSYLDAMDNGHGLQYAWIEE